MIAFFCIKFEKLDLAKLPTCSKQSRALVRENLPNLKPEKIICSNTKNSFHFLHVYLHMTTTINTGNDYSNKRSNNKLHVNIQKPASNTCKPIARNKVSLYMWIRHFTSKLVFEHSSTWNQTPPKWILDKRLAQLHRQLLFWLTKEITGASHI